MSIDVLGGPDRRTPGDIRKQVADIEREYAALIELSVEESVLYDLAKVRVCDDFAHTNLFGSDAKVYVKAASVHNALCSAVDTYAGDHFLLLMPVDSMHIGESYLAGKDSVEYDICAYSTTYLVLKQATRFNQLAYPTHVFLARNASFNAGRYEICVDILAIPRGTKETFAGTLLKKILGIAKEYNVDALIFDPFDWGASWQDPSKFISVVRKVLQDSESGLSRIYCSVKDQKLLELASKEFRNF